MWRLLVNRFLYWCKFQIINILSVQYFNTREKDLCLHNFISENEPLMVLILKPQGFLRIIEIGQVQRWIISFNTDSNQTFKRMYHGQIYLFAWFICWCILSICASRILQCNIDKFCNIVRCVFSLVQLTESKKRIKTKMILNSCTKTRKLKCTRLLL